jgi:hypothetical protein
MTVGKPIQVGEVLNRSALLLFQHPMLMLPQVIVVIPSFLVTLALRGSVFSSLTILADVISFVLGIIVSGAYPFIVKSVIDGGQISISDSMRKAFHRFWTLFGAGLLVGLIELGGFILLIVPGIIFVTWWAYTVPAIMLENKGVGAGMAASKDFGHDKKGSTFLILLIVGIVFAVIFIAFDLLISAAAPPVIGQVVDLLLEIPVGAWAAVIISYTYITYGPSSTKASSGDSNWWIPPPYPTQQPGMQNEVSPSRFCSSCGSPLQSDARFCPSCGKAV